MANSKYYTVYNKADEIIAFGKSRKCANILGITHGSFYSMVSRVRNGRNKKYSILADEDEFEDEVQERGECRNE